MWRFACLCCAISTVALLAAAPHAAPRRSSQCGDPLGFQVLLDRQSFSPGEIDGRIGVNTKRALSAFRSARGLPSTDAADCAAWNALNKEQSTAATIKYTITDEDAAGPFASVPKELDEQAALPSLGYQSLLERLGERFHAAPSLIEQLNRGVSLQPGATISVPDVTPFDERIKPTSSARGEAITVEVSRDNRLRVMTADEHVVFFASVSSGSQHDPLPQGHWKVTGVSWLPPFHYNPELFWDASPGDQKALVKPGPNNPVGVVWIDLNLPHYGIHGTPEPSHVGFTQSHGCVRMTNWDAAHLASLVSVGTPVIFK